MDINASLIEAGKKELVQAKLADRDAHLLVTDKFDVAQFGTTFDYAIAVSLFTHLTMNHIIQCLVRVGTALGPDARFFASYWDAPARAHLAPITHPPAGIVTYYDSDSYHYAFDEVRWMADLANLNVERLGDWGHPRGQMMLSFSRRNA